MKAAKKSEAIIVVDQINTVEARMCVLGSAPLIMERFQLKAWQELILPAAKKNAAERATTLKHDPVAEFRGGCYRNRNPKAPALFHIPNGAFKGALASAALDIPGSTKAKIERLTSVVDVNIDMFGIPNIFCSMVRNSDMARTPDVRTRPIFPEWACKVTIKYVRGLLTERTIGNLFGAAGIIVGIGGWRPQKGGSHGTWSVVEPDNPDFRRIVDKQGRKAQQAALDAPIPYDEDTAELLAWFEAEVKLREREGMLDTTSKKTRGTRAAKTNGRRKVVPIAEELSA